MARERAGRGIRGKIGRAQTLKPSRLLRKAARSVQCVLALTQGEHLRKQLRYSSLSLSPSLSLSDRIEPSAHRKGWPFSRQAGSSEGSPALTRTVAAWRAGNPPR